MGHCRKTALSIFLNTKCNLRCKYCYVGGSNSNCIQKVINKNFIRCAVLDFFKQYSSRHIRFFSTGEVTTSFSALKEITDWIRTKSKGVKFELQTNGYFSKKIAEWIAENMDVIWISCDGSPDVQNYYRPTVNGSTSSEIVERNIKFLAATPLVLGCRSTIGARNVYRQKELIDYFSSLGVEAIMSDPIFEPVSQLCNATHNKESVNLMDYAKFFLQARLYAEKKGIFYGSIYTVNFDEKTEHFCRACIPYPHLTTDGYVSCCDMAYSGTDLKMKDLIYGRYNEEEDRIEYDYNAIKKIKSRTASNMPECQNCEVLYNCAGACLGEALNETGSIFGIKPEVCEVIRYLAKHMPLNRKLHPYLHP